MMPAPSASSRPTSMSASPAAPQPAPAASMPTSPWHSPVPYLFGGLAAMLGLIALALLILACSYWKLNTYLGSGGEDASGAGGHSAADGEGSKSPATATAASTTAFADLVAVVMAGQKTPTFLAAPIVRRTVVDPAAAGTGDGSPETEEAKDRGKAGEGDSGTESDRQLDHV